LNAEYKDAKVKIVDLGNACWTHKHFTDDIQTRQYRAPEVLLGAKYDTTADMWSMGCITFELLTGDLLFDPHAGKTWDREEDHLAMMIELLGNFPKNVSSRGKYAAQYFSKKGELRHIHQLKYWGLGDVLHDKYKLSKQEAQEIADFITPMLEVCNIDTTEVTFYGFMNNNAFILFLFFAYCAYTAAAFAAAALHLILDPLYLSFAAHIKVSPKLRHKLFIDSY
jgi:serine/threonine protein kinase